MKIHSILNFILTTTVSARNLAYIDESLALCNLIDIREITITQVREYYRNGNLTATQLTRCYLNRIEGMNSYLNAVLETNPDAMNIAKELDKKGSFGLPLFGIPILLKDNIGTKDKMQTTAGTLALIGAKPKNDAKVVTILRNAGAIILGKTNLSELSGFLSDDTPPGYSRRGGLTRNPYCINGTIFGSSSGSAVAVASNLAMVALGTETDGSLIGPVSVNAVVALKPSFVSVSNKGIVPLAKSMDTVGVVSRTTLDNWIVTREIIASAHSVSEIDDKKEFRLGVIRNPCFKNIQSQVAQLEETLTKLENMGVVLVDDLSFNVKNINRTQEILVVACEFKNNINQYLEDEVDFEDQNGNRARINNIQDIIDFNTNQPNPPHQRYLDYANNIDSTKTDLVRLKRELKDSVKPTIDHILRSHHLDALIVPSHPLAEGISLSAIARYPIISVPSGYSSDGIPFGISFFGPRGSEITLVQLAHRLESSFPHVRTSPRFRHYYHLPISN